MANAGCGSLATILFLFIFQAALHKGKDFSPCFFLSHNPRLHGEKWFCFAERSSRSSSSELLEDVFWTVRSGTCLDVMLPQQGRKPTVRKSDALKEINAQLRVDVSASSKRAAAVSEPEFEELPVVNRFASTTQLATLELNAALFLLREDTGTRRLLRLFLFRVWP